MLSPKEKADELIKKYESLYLHILHIDCEGDSAISSGSITYFSAIKCSLVAVDEMLGSMGADRGYEFWSSVKKELENYLKIKL